MTAGQRQQQQQQTINWVQEMLTIDTQTEYWSSRYIMVAQSYLDCSTRPSNFEQGAMTQ